MSLRILFSSLLLASQLLSGQVDRDDRQSAALEAAAARELLCQAGYQVDRISNSGDTALHLAVKKADVAAVRLCLVAGLDQRQTNKSGDIALHLAAAKGNLEIVRLLVEAGAPLDWSNNLDQRPYHKALANGHQQVIDFLLQCGAKQGDALTDQLIALGYAPHKTDSAGNGALHKAAINGDLAVIALLLDNGWDIDVPNKSAQTPLLVALGRGKDEAARLLLGRGAAVNRADQKGYCALHRAILKRSTAIVVELLAAHAQVDAYNEKGVTPLHYAIAAGDLYLVSVLLDHGADVNLETMPAYWSEASSWTSHDWDVWDDVSGGGGGILKGHLQPQASPLSIALRLHPNKEELHQLLRRAGAREFYHESPVCETTLSDYLKN